MKLFLAIGFTLVSTIHLAQIGTSSMERIMYLSTSQYNKVTSEEKAKKFLMEHVLQITETPLEFRVDALASATSGEVTTLFYECEQTNQSGLILGFYGDYVSKAGLNVKGYGFYHLQHEDALKFLNKLLNIIDNYDFYDENGYKQYGFVFKEMNIMCGSQNSSDKARIFWNGFDAEWNGSAIKRTLRRFNRKSK